MKLRRSKEDAMVGGVCGGVAESLAIDATLVRIGFVLISLFSSAFPGLIIYLLMWAIIPERQGQEE